MATTAYLPTDEPTGSKQLTVDAVAGTDSPATEHPAYSRMRPRWEKCRALMAGTQAIRDGGTTYLPAFEAESAAGYEVRKKLCALFNGFARTVKACVGLILEKDPAIGEDMPSALATFAEDVDRAGTHLAVYAKHVATDGMIDGHAGTLVDYPFDPNARDRSAEDERARNLRPFWVRYQASDILKVVKATVGGARVTILLVLKETTEELVGDFGTADVVRYRVYRRTATGVTWELWKKGDVTTEKETGPHQMTGTTRIPFSLFIAGDRIGDFETRPPLDNLADLNLEHHQLKTNIRNLETLACVPTLVRVGAEPVQDRVTGKMIYPPVELGPRKTMEVPAKEGAPQNPVYWLSPDISVLEPSNRSLQDVKADMGAAGLAFIAPDKRVAETAEAKRLDAGAQNATLSTVSRGLQDHLEELFQFTAEFMGEASAGSVTLNREFEDTALDSAMISALGSLAVNGNLSIETLLALLEKGRVLPEGFDIPEELRRILAQYAPPPTDPDGESDGNPAPRTRRRARIAPPDADGSRTITIEQE